METDLFDLFVCLLEHRHFRMSTKDVYVYIYVNMYLSSFLQFGR